LLNGEANNATNMVKDLNKLTMPPETYEGLKNAITECYSALSKQLQQIARYSLENPNDLALETVTTIASRAEVQPSAMVRFAQTMGYDGFSTMQQVFRTRLMEGASSYRERIRNLKKVRSQQGIDADSVLHGFVDDGIASLEHMYDTISSDQITRAVKILADAEEIYLLAQGRAFPVAFYIGYALGRLDKKCRILDGVGGLLQQQARQASTRDAFIAVSFKPYTPSVADIVTSKNENGVPIISITDSPLSPLAMNSSLTFEVSENEDKAFRSLVAPVCLAQTIVVALGHKLAIGNGNGEGA